MEYIFDCIIIGSGPAGMSASLYLKRANKKILLLDKSMPGGQINSTYVVDNFLGFDNISGSDLSLSMYNHIKSLGIDVKYGNVLKIENSIDGLNVITDTGSYKTKYVVVSTGRFPKKLGLPDEEKLIGHGISYCATCDGYLFKNKDVAVIGGGNSAFEEANYLSSICNKVYLLNRSNSFRADSVLQDELMGKKNVEIFKNVSVSKLLSNDGKLSGVLLNNDNIINIDGLFIFIGQMPVIIDCNIRTEDDYYIVDSNLVTSNSHIYACGDCIKKNFYQISLAVGEGSLAALNIIKKLDNE